MLIPISILGGILNLYSSNWITLSMAVSPLAPTANFFRIMSSNGTPPQVPVPDVAVVLIGGF